MKYNELETIWADMETRAKAAGAGDGLLRQRVPGERSSDFFLGVGLPGKERFFYFTVLPENLPSQKDFPETRGFKAERVQFPGAAQPCILLRLLDGMFRDIFSSLVTDLILHMDAAHNPTEQVKVFLNRLRKWQYFMKGYQEEGFSPEDQRGLYGELHFLDSILIPRHGTAIVQAWTGPDSAHQDFQFNQCAVEVKTCIQKQPQVITIASEKELDEASYKALFLYHLSLDQNQTSGETLNEKVVRICRQLGDDPAAKALFVDKLRLYGYLEPQASLYDNTFYSVRSSSLYDVHGEFPRILSSDLRNGVGQIKYGISIDVCSEYEIDEAGFHEKTSGDSGI